MLLRFLRVFSLLMPLAGISCAPLSDIERLQLPFEPSIGSHRHFSIVKTKQRTNGPLIERNLKTTSKAELTLEARNDEGFVYRFDITETAASAPGSSRPQLDRLLSRLAGVTDGVPLRYQADTKGVPLRLINTDEVRGAFRGTRSELRELVGRLADIGVLTPLQRPQLEAKVDATLGLLLSLSDQELSSVVLEEVGLLHAATGGDLPLGEKEPFQIQTRVPLVNRPIQVSGERLIKSVDEDTRRAVVGIETGFDRDELLAAVALDSYSLSDSGGSEATRTGLEDSDSGPAVGQRRLQKEIEDLSAFEVREAGLHMLDLDSGEPLAVRHERMMVFGSKQVIEVMKIRRVLPR